MLTAPMYGTYMEHITPETKERTMSVSQIQPVPASSAGALSGFECKCSCGMVLRSSLRTLLVQDASAHVAWHAKQAA